MAHDGNDQIARGRAAVKAGDFKAAGEHARARLAQAPDDIDALELRALAEAHAGDARAAIATVRKAFALDPKSNWAAGDLVQLLHGDGDRAGAEVAARAGLAARPNDANLHSLLGVLRSEIDDLPGGERAFRRAMEIAGAHPLLARNLAINLTRQGRLDEAEELFTAARAATPHDPDIALHWARLCEARGDFARAHALMDEAERHGRDAGLQRAITLSREGKDEAALALLDRAARGGDAELLRGRLLERLGRPAEAWRAFIAGKQKLAARDGGAYDAEAVSYEFAVSKAALTSAFADLPRAEARRDAPQPIFIFGFPRSGTTMLEQMLSSHSAVRAGGELPFAAEMTALAQHELGAGYLSSLSAMPNADAKAFVERCRDFYLARAKDYGLDGGAPLFTDKMPLNEVHAPLLRLAFPEARFVRVIRHPLDVCVSMMANHMTHGGHCAYRAADIAAHMIAIDDLVAHVQASGIEIYAFSYERLIAEQEHETRRLLDWLGLPFEAACLSFHANPRHAPTPSYAQVTAPLNDRSIGRWRQYAEELAPEIAALAPLIAKLGYEA